MVGAPKGALPPLPWQLRDEARREEYESNSFSSAFIRNIRYKAQDMAQAVHQDKMMEKSRARLGGLLEGSTMGGSVAESEYHHALGGGGSIDEDPYSEWNRVTGLTKAQEQAKHLRKAMRREAVTGGLGENRAHPKGKDFDSERLLHPWQRDMMRQRRRRNGETIDEEEDGGAGGDGGGGMTRKARA